MCFAKHIQLLFCCIWITVTITSFSPWFSVILGTKAPLSLCLFNSCQQWNNMQVNRKMSFPWEEKKNKIDVVFWQDVKPPWNWATKSSIYYLWTDSCSSREEQHILLGLKNSAQEILRNQLLTGWQKSMFKHTSTTSHMDSCIQKFVVTPSMVTVTADSRLDISVCWLPCEDSLKEFKKWIHWAVAVMWFCMCTEGRLSMRCFSVYPHRLILNVPTYKSKG